MTENVRIAVVSAIVAVVTAAISSYTTLQSKRSDLVEVSDSALAATRSANEAAEQIRSIEVSRRMEAGEESINFPPGLQETFGEVRFSQPFDSVPIVVVSECRGDGNWMTVKTNTANRESFSWVGLLQFRNGEVGGPASAAFRTHVCWIAIQH